ncbi:hypothetical protein LOZ61_006321 [Ophidiomyces ophidiicola]|nr:hypothetical protein LOZ61_006321 [Ophidiomyces ophidiicola]KAI1922004.1 hypothetical protein LOZ60_005924 [Ophidiomyces ophidiicola]KAI1950013.1 hypothetical protein LOZ59_005949 [Ophidiomyces ophidiicola]KAI2407944.1 hypothetical protein LOY90_003122 [Ophidiomyces ophidiicola]
MSYHPQAPYGADPNDPRGWNQYEREPHQRAYSPHGVHPAAHPDSAYNRLRNQRQYGGDYSASQQPFSHGELPPYPPIGRSQTARTEYTASPGADNLGPMAVGGGISGIATGVANSHERQSGLNAMQGGREIGPYRDYPDTGYYAPSPDTTDSAPMSRPLNSYSSSTPLNPGMDSNYPPGRMAPSDSPYQGHGQPQPHYDGLNGTYSDPYHRQRTSWMPMNEPINPNDIVDDGDDGFIREPKRKSVLGSLGKNPSAQSLTGGAAAVAGGVGAGAMAGRSNGAPDGGPSYNPVPNEKSGWITDQKARKKKMKWVIILVVLVLLVLGGIAGGVVGGLLGSKKNSSGGKPGGSGQSADEDTKMNGDLSKNSKEIQALMNNPNLRKVFPGMDYTPWGSQYPLCLTYPPSQNNVTRDVAVLSRLTNTLRLYGTDCNQTEMVLHAIDRLGLKDMKLWLGVWIDNVNITTNDRQLAQMYKILKETKDTSIFKGVVVGNEVLFRGKQSAATLQMLSNYMQGVKTNLTGMGINLPISTSDLGDAWTAELAKVADVVMSNVHPFFAGIAVEKATDWTYEFWNNKDVALTKGTDKKHVISEVGWPSGGGSNCSPAPKCPDATTGAVAGIKEMNKFLEDWVCTALDKGTNYFWFEAFDEPWKVQYNEPGKEWEDKWGLMDPGRTMKPGLKIPDCGGRTITYANGLLKVRSVDETRAVISSLLSKYRATAQKSGKPNVVHVVHKVPEGTPMFTPGTALAEEMEELKPIQGEKVVVKELPNSFAKTELDAWLKEQGCKKVVLVGYMAHVCVSTTARSANELGYEVVIAQDGVGGRDLGKYHGDEVAKMALLEIADYFGTLVDSKEIN